MIMLSQVDSFPMTGVEKIYFAYLARGEWCIQHCNVCSRFFYYPRQICPHCGADEFDWLKPSGRGRVYSSTTVCPTPDASTHYNVALIDLDEEVRMMSRVEGLPAEGIRIGMRVQARVVHDNAGGVPLIVFDVLSE